MIQLFCNLCEYSLAPISNIGNFYFICQTDCYNRNGIISFANNKINCDFPIKKYDIYYHIVLHTKFSIHDFKNDKYIFIGNRSLIDDKIQIQTIFEDIDLVVCKFLKLKSFA